jgi:hypothetical protein
MVMQKAEVARWAHGHRLASRRIAEEAARERPSLGEALARVDDLREVANDLGAHVDCVEAEEENLAFHVTWALVRRAFGVG